MQNLFQGMAVLVATLLFSCFSPKKLEHSKDLSSIELESKIQSSVDNVSHTRDVSSPNYRSTLDAYNDNKKVAVLSPSIDNSENDSQVEIIDNPIEVNPSESKLSNNSVKTQEGQRSEAVTEKVKSKNIKPLAVPQKDFIHYKQDAPKRAMDILRAIQTNNFSDWRNSLAVEYAQYLSSDEHFHQLEEQYNLSKIGITIESLRTYFSNIVYPSFQGIAVNELNFDFHPGWLKVYQKKDGDTEALTLYCMEIRRVSPKNSEWFIISCK